MPRQLLIDDNLFQTRLALVEDDTLQTLAVELKNQSLSIGDFCLARVTKIDKSLDAAFLDLGNKRTGFLKAQHARQARYLSNQKIRPAKLKNGKDIASLISEGEKFPVQIIKLAHGTKDAQVSTSLQLAGAYSLVNPLSNGLKSSGRLKEDATRQWLTDIVQNIARSSEYAITIRTAAENADEQDITAELSAHIDMWLEVQSKIKQMADPGNIDTRRTALHRLLAEVSVDKETGILVDKPMTLKAIEAFAKSFRPSLLNNISLAEEKDRLFDHYDIDAEIDRALSRTVELPSGGTLVFDQTEALMAIDINSGQHSASGSIENYAFDVNREAVIEIARQIRLRNISGIIIIDCLQMNNKQQATEILDIFRSRITSDLNPVHIGGFTSLGLIELSRKRQGVALTDLMTRPEVIAADIMHACEEEIRKGGTGPIEIEASGQMTALLKQHKPQMELALARQILLKPLEGIEVSAYTLSFPKTDQTPA